MTYEEMKMKFPNNFTQDVCLKEVLDKTAYKYAALVSDVEKLRDDIDSAKQKRALLSKHLENLINGIKGQSIVALFERVDKAIASLDDATFRVNSRMSTIVQSLEQELGVLQGITTPDKIFNIDVDEFVDKLLPQEREFFESVFFDQQRTTKGKMSAKQFSWINKICKKVVGVRFEEIYFSKKTRPEDIDSELE